MHRWILISFFVLTSQLQAAIKAPEINIPDAAISYTGGYLMGYLYDVSAQVISFDAEIDIHKTRRREMMDWAPWPVDEEVPYVEWKLGLGAMAGLAMEVHAADRDNREMNWINIGWGTLGGLTNIVFHF